jgi:hypothetical protein
LAAHKGHTKLGGRAKGTPNKVTASVKEVFCNVFTELQADETNDCSLKKWAQKNPTEFYRIIAKLIPFDVTTDGNSIAGKINFYRLPDGSTIEL